MKSLMKLALVFCVGTTLPAQSTGVISGAIRNSSGNPVVGSVVKIHKIGMNWTKIVPVDANGKFLQVGLDPREYELEVTAEGLVAFKTILRISPGEPINRDIVLYTTKEALEKGIIKQGQRDPTTEDISSAMGEFNMGVALFNSRSFMEALPVFESAHKKMADGLKNLSDESTKNETSKRLEKVEQVLGFTLAEVAKLDPERQLDLNKRALNFIKQSITKNPQEQNNYVYIIDILRALNLNSEADKYQTDLEKLIGPNPSLSYNQAVEAYNAGKMKEARPFLQKTIEIDPKFADAYYLLAMCDYADMNLKSTKQNLQKYLEVAPNGKNAAEAQAMLADPSLKNIK